MQKKLPLQCPSCQSNLKVKKLHCSSCGTEVDGLFDFPLLVSFSQEEQEFILNFVKTSGSLKEMAKIMDLSYPSVRNYVDDIIGKIKQLEKNKKQ
ncbi:MAG TPA: DUF2089 family protein [Bacteroidia bacterium]|jgi:hypothetical protein|nr:DUF2089 family protein [Bacteroidia bacterium]